MQINGYLGQSEEPRAIVTIIKLAISKRAFLSMERFCSFSHFINDNDHDSKDIARVS